MKLNQLMLAGALFAMGFGACKKDDDDNNNIQLNSTDQNFMRMAAYGNNAEVDAGNLSASQATDASVKNFGAMMVTDHTTAQGELVAIGSKYNMSLPTTPDSAHLAMKQLLMSLTGRAFDSAYIHAQVMDHQTTINLYQQEITNGNNEDVKNYASKYLPKVQMHKMMADSIAARF